MSYINSQYINVFPTAYREQPGKEESALTTEKNITEFLRAVTGLNVKLPSNKGFIYSVSGDTTITDLKFVLSGYLFELTEAGITQIQNSFTNGEKTIYAKIRLGTYNLFTDDTNNTQSSFLCRIDDIEQDTPTILDEKLEDKDDEYVFYGIDFVSEVGADNDIYLLLFTKPEDTWKVAEDSKLKYNTDDVAYNREVLKIDLGGTSEESSSMPVQLTEFLNSIHLIQKEDIDSLNWTIGNSNS